MCRHVLSRPVLVDATPMTHPNIPEFELRVLNHLWEHDGLTARQLTDLMYPHGNHASYTTVKKLLERLESKGFVRRSDSERAHRFTATVDRETLVANELESVIDRLCEGSVAPLVSALVQRIDLSKKQRAELGELISEFQSKNTNKTGRRT